MYSSDNLTQWAEDLQSGNRVSLGKAITLIESKLPEHKRLADQLLDLLLPYSSNSRRIAVTGVPGVGKSTFIETFGLKLIKESNQSVAVLAIDPSSSISGGSILGDKTRMNELSKEEKAFIRPTPSGGHLGGVGERTMQTILLCEAAGFQNIIIETVGVGQSETEIRHMADLFLLLMLPGAGDELQGIKRGIIEMTDIMVLNKSDRGENDIVLESIRQYKSALHFFPDREDGWKPVILAHSMFKPDTTSQVMKAVNDFFLFMSDDNKLENLRSEQRVWWFQEQVRRNWLDKLYMKEGFSSYMLEMSNQILQKTVNPFHAARTILEKLN